MEFPRSSTGQMFVPPGTNDLRVEGPFIAERFFVEQLFSPGA